MTTPTTPALAVQTALYGVLTGDAELTGLAAGGVHDFVPEPAPYPYVHLGEAVETPWNTHGGYGRETAAMLHVWSRYRGFAEALRIAARVIALLDHQPLTVAGHGHISTEYEFMQTITDPDPSGLIRHVPIRFRVRTEQPRA